MSIASIGLSLATSYLQKPTPHAPAQAGAVGHGKAVGGHRGGELPKTGTPPASGTGGAFADLLQAFT
ncbi:MAG: hypothetical protein B7Z80_02440 [Rhodospirillales bacterium 20-64-7]|nr:MAG: hypothetical protein B7Z80_02440 [Rhodospirillales bacterium 20-64-7]HQT76262.1 hypothetical protein [Rhodopila sp.]